MAGCYKQQAMQSPPGLYTTHAAWPFLWDSRWRASAIASYLNTPY